MGKLAPDGFPFGAYFIGAQAPGGRKGRPCENSSGDAPVGADDSVGPIGDRIAIVRADRVVRPYG